MKPAFLFLFIALMISLGACKLEESNEDRFVGKPALDYYEVDFLDTVMKYDPKTESNKEEIVKKKSKIYTIPNQLPVFPGCGKILNLETRYACSDKKLLNFVSKNIRYPEASYQNATEGVCVVSFVITQHGVPILEKIEKSIAKDIDQVVLDMIAKMRKEKIIWEPGIVKGEKVNVKHTLPVNFSLN